MHVKSVTQLKDFFFVIVFLLFIFSCSEVDKRNTHILQNMITFEQFSFSNIQSIQNL